MIGRAHGFDCVGGVLVSVTQKLERLLDAPVTILLTARPASGVGRTRQQVGGIDLGADVGLRLLDACQRVIIDGQGFLRIAMA